MTLQIRNPEMVSLLAADFQLRSEPNFAWKSACSAFLALPGLRGFWPMSSFDNIPLVHDLSAQDRHLTYNGNPRFNFDGLAPYIDLDGTGDYLSRADEAGLDILGTESYVASAVRGVTLIGWFYPTNAALLQPAMAKWGAAQRSYMLTLLGDVANDPIQFGVSEVGFAYDYVTLYSYSTNAWQFLAGRFCPADTGEELAVWRNDAKETAATSLNSIFNSNVQFTIGGWSGGVYNQLVGRASMCALCAAALSDSIITALYQQTRSMYGV